MNYIENIYVCLAAPLIIVIMSARKRARKMQTFLLTGMTVCLLSSYISTFLASAIGAGIETASITIVPVVEEIMKVLPVLFYLLVFEPEKELITDSLIMTAIGFATFENVCYMTQNGTAQVLHLLIRGFGTGALHIICGLIISYGMIYLWDRVWLRIAGMIGLLSATITYHGIYNIMVSQDGFAATAGYLIPIFTAILINVLRWKSGSRD